MCLNPSYIKNRKYLPNKKNGGVVPPVSDNRVLIVPVGCGVCIECKKQESRSWQIRLKEDIKRYKNPVFVTLTFSEQSLKKMQEIVKSQRLYMDSRQETIKKKIEEYQILISSSMMIGMQYLEILKKH